MDHLQAVGRVVMSMALLLAAWCMGVGMWLTSRTAGEGAAITTGNWLIILSGGVMAVCVGAYLGLAWATSTGGVGTTGSVRSGRVTSTHVDGTSSW